MLSHYPKIPIDPLAFSGMTFRVRYPKILDEVINSNLYNQEIRARLHNLKSQLDTLVVKRIHENDPLWEVFYADYEEKNLNDLPFFDAEVYLFAYILHLTDYDRVGTDPFSTIKSQDLEKNQATFDTILLESKDWDTPDFVLGSLHGNKSDLSQLKSAEELSIQLLLDDRPQLLHDFECATHVDMILDNAGMELFSDLMLVNHLVDRYGHQIKLHIKSAPIFVSDVIQSDIDNLLSLLAAHGAKDFADAITNKIEQEQIIVQANPFWTSPQHFSQLPVDLITPHSLLLSKGDANYRRFFEDRIIPSTQPSASLIKYLKHPTYCIRTLKSDIQTGLTEVQCITLDSQEIDWKVNGTRAVIQMLH
ncbi:damage-control phosphatase ARMT1 family protein [Reichenbachiella agarivorans]|uniref:Damage-control phosphatase ARMT1 family protein n=1 Tax=Reichenbachiella agarivorans TaxID=2979464 RepID=A0ABY6CKW5_9BACT|nr:damage-control phosphatase ARMT1 family protein [Reichenbachiella agarivorans]UXP31166.1 damage-control phosphatase ARMT1 family protein [Reichenbachiella agarivorans]